MYVRETPKIDLPSFAMDLERMISLFQMSDFYMGPPQCLGSAESYQRIAVFAPENLETSLKVSTLIISFGKRESVRRCLKLVSTKSNSTTATQTNLIF